MTSQTPVQNGVVDLDEPWGDIAIGEAFVGWRFSGYWFVQFTDGFRIALLLPLQVLGKCIHSATSASLTNNLFLKGNRYYQSRIFDLGLYLRE